MYSDLSIQAKDFSKFDENCVKLFASLVQS